MKRIIYIISAVFSVGAFLGIFGGCDNDNIDGGPCNYVSISGVATITAVKTADSLGNNCKNAVEVIFKFVPNSPIAASRYRFPLYPDTGRNFTVGDGKNPPANWALNKGLIEQSSHECVRQEIINGTCSPVIFNFPDIDCSDYEIDCF